jgi:hypothetical protein
MRRSITLALTFALSSPLSADWVDLKDGTALRGVEFKRAGKQCVFTLEDGRTVSLRAAEVAGVRKSPPDERVEFRGNAVTLAEKVKVLKEEAKKREREAARDLEAWAAGKQGAEAARERFAALDPVDREHVLAAVLAKGTKPARRLAARELAAHKSKPALAARARAAVKDADRAVRSESLDAIEAAGGGSDAGASFAPYLSSASSPERTRAALAIERFPSRDAVPVLIETMKLVWDDFGRGFFFQGEQRSFIKDYNLVSGGTGFQIIEVADPEVSTVTTGVVLDVKVRKVEMVARVRALREITGQDFGADVKKWREWWKSEGGK